MKSHIRRQRKINSIATGRWAAYTAAAAASTFAAASSAEATIHYSGPINQNFKENRKVSFPLDPAGGMLVLKHYNHHFSGYINGGSAFAFVYAAVSGSANGFKLSCAPNDAASVSNLNRGDSIPARPFVPDGGILATRYNYGCGPFYRGQFLERERDAFFGFKFNNGAGVQYGWARLKVGGLMSNNFTLVDFAYGDPGETIVAGQTQSTNSAPVMESLGGLALGGAGLLAWRRLRSR